APGAGPAGQSAKARGDGRRAVATARGAPGGPGVVVHRPGGHRDEEGCGGAGRVPEGGAAGEGRAVQLCAESIPHGLCAAEPEAHGRGAHRAHAGGFAGHAVQRARAGEVGEPAARTAREEEEAVGELRRGETRRATTASITAYAAKREEANEPCVRPAR